MSETNDRELAQIRRDIDLFTSAVEKTVAELYEEITLLRRQGCDGQNE